MKGKLTDRQRKFVDLYLELGNATKAAEQAGFKSGYAQGAMRQPAVQAYMEERRKQLPVQGSEVFNFLTGVMRGSIKATQLQTDAAYQMGRRAGLWHTRAQYNAKIKEAVSHE